MMGKTHKAGGVLCALAGIQVINSITPITSDIHPLLQFAIAYPFCMWGSTAPDLDHDWSNVEDKNPINWGIHKLLHIGNELADTAKKLGDAKKYKRLKLLSCNHRSWQTHSDFTIVFLLILRWLISFGIIGNFSIGLVNRDIAILILNGIVVGIGAHLFLDLLTVAGLKLLSVTFLKFIAVSIIRRKFTPVKIVTFRLVPKTDMFSTGTEMGEKYEKTVRQVLSVTTYLYSFCWILCCVFKIDLLGMLNIG